MMRCGEICHGSLDLWSTMFLLNGIYVSRREGNQKGVPKPILGSVILFWDTPKPSDATEQPTARITHRQYHPVTCHVAWRGKHTFLIFTYVPQSDCQFEMLPKSSL